jgi:hypothetical protein
MAEAMSKRGDGLIVSDGDSGLGWGWYVDEDASPMFKIDDSIAVVLGPRSDVRCSTQCQN